MNPKKYEKIFFNHKNFCILTLLFSFKTGCVMMSILVPDLKWQSNANEGVFYYSNNKFVKWSFLILKNKKPTIYR